MAPIEGRIEFTKKYAVKEALRGLEGFSRIWLIWGFSQNKPAKGEWQPTVRPPRLGGNAAMGVFATRSPYRPNPLGLSCVELVGMDGTNLIVKGADLADGTPIFDIKPYIPYADSFPDAAAGFANEAPEKKLEVIIPEGIGLNPVQTAALKEVLSLDPRPAYHPEKEYALPFEGHDVRFTVEGNTLTVSAWD